MRLAMPFRRPFEALEEGLQEAGCEIDRKVSSNTDAVIVDFCDAVRAPLNTWKLRRRISDSTPLIAIARDAPWHKGVRRNKLWLNELLKPFDIYATHTLQDADRCGRSTLYLPNAARISHYNLGSRTLDALRTPSTYRYQVTFIGNIDAVNYPEHAERLEFLLALKERLKGKRIELTLVDSSRGLSPQDQIEVIQSSQINLNHGAACDRGGIRSWGLPERCYGIPACGGFLLSDDRRHACDDFTPGVEWASYDDIDSCVDRIGYYLENHDKARDIAEAAYARILNCHTYRHRANTLIESIRQWKK